jgi:hypothetical protein
MTMGNEHRDASMTEDTEGHAIRRDRVGEAAGEDDAAGHVGLRKISDAGTDDDTEGNKLK